MCCCDDKKKGCRKPEDLKTKPEDCSDEQIRECHGETGNHPCEAKSNRKC